MYKIKVLIVDDHLLIRTGIKSLLKDSPLIHVIGEAENGNEAIEKFEKLRPDVVLMDISMPGISGIEATRIIKEKYSLAKILILTMYDSEEYILSSVKNGASGVLHKNVNKKDLIDAINTVAEGKKYFGQELTQLLIENLVSRYDGEISAQQKDKIFLTIREKEILYYIADGMSNMEIADKLKISPRTVDSHKTNIMQKYNIKTTGALARFAFENGFYIPKKR